MALVPASKSFLTDPDTGMAKRELSKLFNEQLRSLKNLRDFSAQLQFQIDEHWTETLPLGNGTSRIGLAGWVFDMLAHSMGTVFWGKKGPFEDTFFREQLRVFIQNLEALRNPLFFLIPRNLRLAREYVRRTLDQAAADEAYGDKSQLPTLFQRLAIVYEVHGVPSDGFTDCHLVAIVGLLSNVINIMAWAMCHITADKELEASISAELKAVVDNRVTFGVKEEQTDLQLDVDKVRSACPLLLATWYELLRVYGDSPVARYVDKDCVFDAEYRIKQGSMVMTPIHLRNFNQDIWGPDADAFRPSRFLRKQSGHIDSDLVKHLEVFGLPGMHQCPGRYLAMNMFLALVAKVLLTFEITPALGAVLSIPKRKETMLGLPVMADDPDVWIKRRPGVRSVHVGFEAVRAGW
ncbi:hypothetical protein E8E12_010026 [Didymella heteroderae]|uniref:Cytochrome P450 n=1 Tax=Didymella heteroderae TaxID=1769908 RepID=A0A9P4WUE9_9PLEO|nr:hypothetical protein E8E12_010026 [Didymella heteroderae]